MPLNDFLPFALGSGSNVITQADYAALGARGSGFVSGTARSAELNKVWRQSAFAVSCIAQFMADYTGNDILDDGDDASFRASLAKAISALSMGTGYAVGANTGNAYTASFTPAVSALVDGMVLRFKAATANTGAATFSPNGLPAKPIVNLKYASLAAGDIAAGSEIWLQYNSSISGGSWVSILSIQDSSTVQKGIVRLATASETDARSRTDVAVSPGMLSYAPGFFYGFTMSNNATTPNTTVDIGAGAARSADNTVDIKLDVTLRGILQASGSWAAGDNQNKLDTGARANSTWYHVFAIRKTSDGTGDLLFSLSATAPTMPSGYAGFRWIGAILVNASGNITPFVNIGREFFWKDLVQDAFSSGTPPVNLSITLRVPTGVRVKARVDALVKADNGVIYLRPTDTNTVTLGDPNTSSWIAGISTVSNGTSNEVVAASSEVITNTSGQVMMQTFTALTNAGYGVTTKGYEVFR